MASSSSSSRQGDIGELRARARGEMEEIERQKMQDGADEEKAVKELEFYSRAGKMARERVAKPAGNEEGDGKGARFRSAPDVLDRIRWDSRYDSSEYVVGYLERFSGIMEISVNMWRKDFTEEEFVPQHRIKYVKNWRTGEVVWDRERRMDLIFRTE